MNGWLSGRLCHDRDLALLQVLEFVPLIVPLTSLRILMHLRIYSYLFDLFGRGERIRTSDHFHPKEVRYQAALRPDPLIITVRPRARRVC